MTARPVRVAIAGVTAYTGQQAARLIAGHPGFELVSASSDAMAGRRIDALIPDLGPDGQAHIVGHGDDGVQTQANEPQQRAAGQRREHNEQRVAGVGRNREAARALRIHDQAERHALAH